MKKTTLSLDKNGNIKDYEQLYDVEENESTVGMTKRMVASGASQQVFGKGVTGINKKIKVAIIDDLSAPAFGLDGGNKGSSEKLKVFDGGAYGNGFWVRQAKASLPGLGLSDTMKPIGTSNGDFSSSLLKFAVFGIDNEKVRTSINGEVNLDNLMYKMNNFETGLEDFLMVGDKIYDVLKHFPSIYLPQNGKYKELTGIKNTAPYEYQLFFNSESMIVKDVKTLYDIWQLFGGAFVKSNINDQIDYSDVSMDIVHSIVVNNEIEDLQRENKLRLKDKMVAMITPASAVKNGITNVNPKNKWKDNTPLMFYNYDTSFFGIQLDATHHADDSEINEITQVVSAIMENNATPELANDLYDTIGRIVKEELIKFSQSTDMAKDLTDNFVRTLSGSSQINNIKDLVKLLDGKFAFSNKSAYKAFIASVVSKIKSDYIRRKFAGIAAVLNPSHGVMQVYDYNGKTYSFTELSDIEIPVEFISDKAT